VISRRVLLTGTAAAVALPSSAAPPAGLREIEAAFGGRIGVAARRGDRSLTYRAGERFALLSTFKFLAAAAILLKAWPCDPGLLDMVVRYREADLVEYSPITERHVDTGMTVEALCDAAVRYSDNTAGNLLLRLLGGPAGLTRFARRIGDRQTRLDRWETDLNTNLPGDPRDTTTPAAMAADLDKLVLGAALAEGDRERLTGWLVANTTGDKRIRAGLPTGWRVGDKTGTGAYGAANDVAVAWPPAGEPLVIAVYTTRFSPDADPVDDVVAEVARVVADELGR
jgi:beta-lactamase class A